MGTMLMEMWCAGYKNIEGVELVGTQAEIARRQAADRIQITTKDGNDYIKTRKNTYDVIAMIDVLEHIPPELTGTLLQSIHAALVPGGRVVMRTPNMANFLASYSRYIDVTHVTGFTELSIMQLLDQNNFENHCLLPDRAIDMRHWKVTRPWR